MASSPVITFHKPEDLAVWIGGCGPLIGIEGFCGAGKSHLVRNLKPLLNAQDVETDEFVRLKDGDYNYLERLNLTEMKRTLQTHLDNGTRVLFHGICLREIADILSIEPVLYIYVKSLSQNNPADTLWHDGINLEMIAEGSHSLDEEKEPHKSAYIYHLAYKPHELAEAYYERFDAV